MGENFAFFLPIMMASFGVAFLIVWGWGAREAGWWSGAFFSVAMGFAVPVAFDFLPTDLWGIVADTAFATGFLLISIPLIAGRGQLRGWPDRALYAAVTLVALDNLLRGSSVSFTLPGGVAFRDSQYAFLMQALACMFGLFLALSALAAAMQDVLTRYRHDAHVDPLSGLLNRRGFEEAVARHDASGSLIACDIDHFKRVNDAHGHGLGDRVIVALADALRALAPADAVIARFGGEEFILFLPGADPAMATGIADAIRLRFAEQAASRLGLPGPLTASFGLTSLHRADRSIHDAIARADSALYEAKEKGRNRVAIRPALAPAGDAQSSRAIA